MTVFRVGEFGGSNKGFLGVEWFLDRMLWPRLCGLFGRAHMPKHQLVTWWRQARITGIEVEIDVIDFVSQRGKIIQVFQIR